MDVKELFDVIKVAERFIDCAEDAAKAIATRETVIITGSKETAAARRASMDLTRALAELRKP